MADKTSNRRSISVTFDMPEKVGDTVMIERPLDGLQILIERVPPRRLGIGDFVVVTGDPNSHDRGLHVARKTDAPRRSRVVVTAFCSEETNRPVRVGQRLDAVPLASVTCAKCINKLHSIGIGLTARKDQ